MREVAGGARRAAGGSGRSDLAGGQRHRRECVCPLGMNLTEHHRVHERERTVSCEFVPPFLAAFAVGPLALELLGRLFPLGVGVALHYRGLIPCRCWSWIGGGGGGAAERRPSGNECGESGAPLLECAAEGGRIRIVEAGSRHGVAPSGELGVDREDKRSAESSES